MVCVHPQKGWTGMGRRNLAGIYEVEPPWPTQQDEQRACGQRQASESKPSPPGSQTANRSASGQRAAASPIRPRTGFAGSAMFFGTRAAIASFAFTRVELQCRRAFEGGAATTARARTDTTGFSLGGLAADPVLVGPFILELIEVRRGQLLLHGAPPEKANTRTMWTSVNSSRQ